MTLDGGAIARAFALGGVREGPDPVARGELGRVWRLATDRGTWAVKELWQPMTEPQARADVAFQLAALEAGVRLPPPQLRPDGSVLATVGPTTIRVYEWVDLTNGVPDPLAAGAILARLHQLAVPASAAPHPWFREAVGSARWTELAGEADAAGVPWAASLRALVPELVELESVLVSSDGLICCHLDFCPDNVLIGRDGRPVVIDWENSGPETPERELAMAALDFGDVDSFLEGYAGAGGSAVLRSVESFVTAIAVQGHLLEFHGRRGLAAASSEEDRERSAWRIRDILARPITRQRIDALLAGRGS